MWRAAPWLAAAMLVAFAVAGASASARAGESGVAAGALPRRPLPASWQGGPVRAAWIVRDALVTEEGARRAIREVAEAGMRVAFVQVVGRSDAYYRSDYLPRGEAIRDGGAYDPLAVVLDEAAACGVEVHAWVNVFFVWSGTRPPRSPAHVVAKHPEWTLAGADLKPFARLSQSTLERRGAEGVYLSPAHPAVHQHVRRYVREILERYNVAGVHLDYVRYPTPDAGYESAAREGFERRTGVDALEMVRNERGLAMRLGRDGLGRLKTAWRDYRADQVTALVREIASDLRALRPDALLTAAVRPNPDDARNFYGQDWVRWLTEGTLDAAAPMCYVRKTGEFAEMVRKICDRVDAGRVLAGVSVYNQTAHTAAEKIQAADACGMLGTCIFSWNSIADDRGYVGTVTVAMGDRKAGRAAEAGAGPGAAGASGAEAAASAAGVAAPTIGAAGDSLESAPDDGMPADLPGAVP